MPSPDYDPNAGGPTTGENRSSGENTPESLPDREDRRRQEDIPQPRNAFRREERSHGEEGDYDEEGEGQFPAGGPIPATVEVGFIQALSGDALKVSLSASGRSSPLEELGAATGRVPAVVYLWGIQAPRPGQPFGAAATEAAGRICEGKRLHVAVRSAGRRWGSGSRRPQPHPGPGGSETRWKRLPEVRTSLLNLC